MKLQQRRQHSHFLSELNRTSLHNLSLTVIISYNANFQYYFISHTDESASSNGCMCTHILTQTLNESLSVIGQKNKGICIMTKCFHSNIIKPNAQTLRYPLPAVVR